MARHWAGAAEPALHVWLGYTPLDREQRRNRTFIMLSVRRRTLGVLLDLVWPGSVQFTNRVFAEDREIVELEQTAFDRQGRDENNEVFPPIRDLRELLISSGLSPKQQRSRDPTSDLTIRMDN